MQLLSVTPLPKGLSPRLPEPLITVGVDAATSESYLQAMGARKGDDPTFTSQAAMRGAMALATHQAATTNPLKPTSHHAAFGKVTGPFMTGLANFLAGNQSLQSFESQNGDFRYATDCRTIGIAILSGPGCDRASYREAAREHFINATDQFSFLGATNRLPALHRAESYRRAMTCKIQLERTAPDILFDANQTEIALDEAKVKGLGWAFGVKAMAVTVVALVLALPTLGQSLKLLKAIDTVKADHKQAIQSIEAHVTDVRKRFASGANP